MLQDRGLLVQDGARYVVTGDVSDLDVPETLHALVASRLDGLSAEERSLLQDASVLGVSFTAEAAAVLGGLPEAEARRRLDGLVAKQVLARDEDPRSPERGQYAFLQALLRTVAYGTLGRRTRKARHVAAARHLEQSWPGQGSDIAEVLASHYLEAVRAEPEADDVGALRASARETLSAAGRAAASMGLGPEASRYFEQAGELAEDELERAQLLEQAGHALWHSGDVEGAERRLREAIELYRRTGRTSGDRATVTLARLAVATGRIVEARSLLEPFREPQGAQVDLVVRAEGLAELARVVMMGGDRAQALPLLESALRELEAQEAWPALAETLTTRAVFLIRGRRTQEGIGVLRQTLRICEDHDLSTAETRARFNLAATELEADRLREASREVTEGLTLARKRGDRVNESLLLSQHVPCLVTLGEWDEASAAAETLFGRDNAVDATYAAAFLVQAADARGDDETLERCRTLGSAHRDSTDVDLRFSARLVLARCALVAGDPRAALKIARALLDDDPSGYEMITAAYEVCLEAAVAGAMTARWRRWRSTSTRLPRSGARRSSAPGRRGSPPTAWPGATPPMPASDRRCRCCATSAPGRCSPARCWSEPGAARIPTHSPRPARSVASWAQLAGWLTSSRPSPERHRPWREDSRAPGRLLSGDRANGPGGASRARRPANGASGPPPSGASVGRDDQHVAAGLV